MARHSEMSEMTLTLTPPQDAPVLLGGVVSVVAQEGDDAVLSSPLAPNSGLPTTILWTRGDDPLAGERFSSSTGRGAVTLTVRNATVEDSGRYSLTAQNNAGQTRSDLLLEVRTRPGDVPVFLRRLNDLAVKVGTRTRFLVEIRSPTQVKVSWEQEGTPIVEGERFHLLHEGSFFCVDLAPVTLEDAGLWMCRAHNASGTSTCFCHLSVLVPKAYKAPHFIEELVALLTEQGTVSLECKVVGVPTPTLKWFKDNQEIKAGDVFALSASPEDAASLGTYTCEATNCMGRSYSTSRVHIIGPDGKVQPVQSLIPRGPPPVFSKELQNGKVKIGGKLTLECKVKVPPWPKSVDWFNKEGQVESGGRYRVREDGLGACSMEVEAVEAGDEGPWKCVATSDAGVKGISNCNVTVSYPKNYKKPKFLESLKAILTEEGLVSFECKVVGYPTPQLRWFKDGQELKPGDVYQLTGTNSLGSYCCIAKNCMGQTSSSAELTVEDIQSQLSEEERLQLFSTNQPPRFHQGLKSIEAKIMDPLRFTVQVSVSPQPTVCWYRDEQEVLDSDRLKMEQETKGFCHLTIKRLELADQAEWKCVATNDYGQSVTSCFLKLAVPRHYKKPRFLENLRAVLSEEGAVNLECKVIGVPQPTLKWYKDGRELKPGDIHRIISGQDGTCCLGTYTCEASNCMGTVASSASLLGFEDRGQVKAPEPVRPLPPPSAHLARHPSLSTIQEERTSQMHDPVTLDERPEVSFSFDGKEVSVSLYETPDLTEEEALQVVEMYADELSEHISEHNVIELPPMRFVKETSTSGHLLMEAMVIDVSPEYFTSAEDRTEADLDEFSITEDNGFMSPLVLTPEEMPFDKFTADFLERSIQPIAVGQKPVPAKPPRKRGAADASESSYHSVKEAKISPEEDSSEHFIDALSSEKDKSPKEIILDMGFEAKEIKETVNIEHIESSLGAGQSGLEVGVLSTESNKKVSESKILSKKSRSRSKSIEAQPVEKVAVESQLSIDSGKKTQKGKLKKRKSSESEKEDDSLQEFEKRKSLKSIEKQNEQLQKKQTTKKPKSSESEKEDDSLQEYESRKILKQSESEFENSSKKTKYNKKGTSDSSGRDDDSLIEYERRKKSSEASSEKASQKLERPKGLLTKSVSTDSSEKDDAFAIKSDISDQAMRKKRKKSVKKSNLTDKKDQKVETGVEIPPSSEAESIDRESFKGKKGISTSDLDRMRSISDLESIGDKSRAQEEEDRSADFDTAEDSAYDKSEMSVLESLNHSIKEIQKGLAAVEGRVISESSEEPQSAKSSLSAIESLALPVKEIQRSLEEVERMAEETEAGQYSPSSILDTLRSPIEELGRNLAVIEQTKEVNSIEESLLTKTSLSLLETVGQPLQELQKELAFIQQQALIETGEEMYSEILQSFKPPLLVVQGGVEQSEREYSSKLDDLTDNTVIPQATYAQPVEENKHMTTGKVLLENESDSLVPLTVKDLEGSLDETLVSSSKLGDFALYNELQLYTSGLEACLLALKEKAQTATDNEIKDILISTSNLVTPLEQFKTVIERCLILVVENDKSTDPQVRSRNIVLKAALESPVHALGNSLHLLEAVCASKTDKEIRGLGIKVLYKLSFPLEELKTTMKLVENLSEHTCIELLVAPVENLLATLSVINPDASKVGFAENIYHEGVNVIKDIDCSVESLSSTLSSIPNTTQTIVSLSKLVKPLTELQKNFCKLENKIKSEENYNQITKSEILSLAQDLCKPLQAIRTELSLVQHEIELDQYSSLSLSAEPVEGTTPDSLLTAVHQSLEQVYKSVLTSTEFVLSKSPDESLHLRYLLYALNELVLPFNQLCSSVSKAKELEFVEAVKTSESNIGIKSVASSVNELLNALSALQQQSSSPLCQSESAIVKVVCEMTEPLAQVESGLCRIIGQVHEENKNILNINMVKTLAEPFKNLQKSLISISSKFDSEQFSEEIAQELRQPIQELQRSILVIQDQVSFEYGDEPATIESNIVTLQSLVQPLNVLKKYFLEMEQVILDQTQSTSYSGEDKKIHSIMKLTHELQLKVSSIMIKENYLSKHSLDSLDMFPIFQDLSSSLSDFEVSLKRVNLVCQGSPKSSLLVHNKLTETVNSFLVKVNDLQGRIVLLSNKTSRDRKHPVHVFKKGTEQFLNQLSENAGVMMTCDLNETSILIVNSLFFNNLSESINQLTDLITKMESVFKGKLSFAEAFDEDSFDMSIISSSDTIKDVTTIMEEVTQTRLSLESTDIPSSKLTPLVKVGHELQYFCDSLKIAEERIMENISTKASNLSIDKEEERRALIVEFSNMKLQLGKIETFVSESFEALESVKHLKYALEVIQEHLKYGEEISEVYILQNLSVPLKTFKEVISKESALYKATCSQTQKPDSVATYLEKFEKSTSDLELGLMKLEHALINSTGDFSSLKNMDVSVIAHPIEELVHYINVIEDQQSFLDASESLADQSSLSMLKTLALPIKEIQEGVLQIQEQIVLETSDQAPTGKTCAGILYEIAKPIRELRSGVALIQEQVLMEADLEPLSEDIAISSLQTLAAPVEELKKVLEGVIEQESVLFEPDLQSMSENMSILKTIAKPLKELQSKIASTEINQILEGNVQSFSVKDNMLALAKPVHDLQECIALVENQIAFEAIEGDISVQASISVLQKVAKPLLEVAKCIAIISEQNFVEAAESENHTIASDLTTLASETDVSFKSAVLNVHEPVILEQGISFVESAPHQKFADMTDERDLEKPVLGVQHGVVESVLESESSAVSEAEISEVNQARAVPKVNEEAYPSAGYLQQPLSMVETLSTNETLTMESADIKEVTENIALNNMVQEPLLSAFTLSADEQTLTEADIKDKTLNIAAHVEVQQPLSKGETLSIEDNLISTVGKEGVESNFLVQGQLQQSLADVESIETEEDTLESVSIQESSFNVEQIVGIQQTLSDVVSFTETEKTLQIAGVKNDLREPLQIETQQPMVVEGVLESFEKSSIIASVGETTPQLAANIQVQEALSNVEDLNISKEVSCIASFHDESILEGALQVEYQEALSNIESLTSEQHSEKQSQEICIEEPFNRIALQTEILKFMSVADEVQAIKEELTAKVSCEPALTELAHTEIQQVLAFAKDIESIKESLQAKSVEEPQLHMITQTDLIDVLNACESSVLVKELLTVKSVVIPPMQKVIETEMQQILSSCQSLQNIKQAITEQIKETKSDSRSDADDVQPQKDDLLGKENLTKPEKEQLEMIEENLEVAIKCKAELSEQSLETVSKHLFPSDEPQIDVDKGVQFVEQSSIQNELHEFISVAENISTITETLEAKFSTQPRLKVVVEQEIQQILHVAEEIQTIKENLKAKHVEEYPLLLATQIECQQVLIACEDMIAAKEALESKLAQDVSIKIALQPEMQLILASTNVLESFKQALAVRVVELNVEQNLEISQTLSDVTSLTESDQKFQVADIEGVVRESFAVSANLQEALSNVGDLSISKEVTGIASLQDQSLKEGVLQVEYQEVLTDLKSLSSEQYSEKQSQEILIEEPFNRIAVKTEILNFMSVADEVQAVKEELTAKVSQEPSLQKLVHTEIQQVLAFAKAIESIKESLQTKSVEEPQLHKITQTDLIDVLNACESSILVKELLEVKSVEMPPIQKVIKTEIQKILSSCQSLQNIKQVITEQIKEAESDSMTDVVEVQSGVDALGKENSTKPAKEQPEIVKENLEAAIKYKAELSEQSSQTYLKDNFPSVKLQTDDEKALTTVKQPSFQNELQDFVSVAENLSTITDKLQAKFSIEPRLKLAAQQEIQQLLHAAEEIQTIKESLKAKSVGESPLVRASQVEVQKVLAACEVIITAKEDLKSKSAKDVSIKTALHSELQDIFASTDTLANIKDTLTAHTIQFNLEQNIGIQQTLSHVTSFTETEKTLHVVGVGGDVRESFAASVQLQEALSNVGDLDILKEVTGIASLQDQSLKEGVLQVEYQEVLTDLKILSSEQYSDKQSQEILIEEPFNRIAVQTEILNFISVADEVQAVKEELTAKVSQEPSLQKLVHTEIQQVLAFAKAIESIKESLQTKSVEEPQLHKITQTDLIDVLNACESSILVKELLKVKSVEMPPIQKVIKTEIQQILSSCQSLQNIKQKITEQIKEAKSDSMSGVFEVQSGIDVLEKDNLTKHAKEKSDMVKENLEAAIKCKAQLSEQSSETDLTDKFPSVKPQTVDEKAISTVQQPFQNEVQEFISVAENMSTITEKLQAKFSTEPRLKLAAQQEFQQLLHAAEEIQTLKESFTAKHVGESPLLLATQLEVQQVLNACEDIITAKEALESKSTKDVSVKIALKSELNLISESTDILANIKQALTAHITQEDTLKVLAQTETVQIFTPVESLKEGSSDSQQANIKGFPLQTVSVLEVLPITSPEVKQMEAMCSNVDPESGVKPAQSEKDISQELSLQEDKSSQQIDDITKLKVEMLKANMQVFKQSLQKTPLHFASQEDVNLVLSAVQSLESVKEILTSKPIKELSLDVALESHIQQVLATTETLSIIVQDLKTSESSDPLFQGKINTEVKLILAATENINTVTYMLEETKTKQPKSHIAQSVLPELLNKTLQLESALEKIQEKVVQEDLVDAPSENKSVPNKELSNIQVDRKTIGKINELKKSTEIETEQLLKEEMKNEVDDAKAISAQETSIHDSKATSKSDTKSVQESSSHEENNIGLEIKIRDTKSASLESEKVEPDVETTIAKTSGQKLGQSTIEVDQKITGKVSSKTKKGAIGETEVVEKPSKTEEKDNVATTAIALKPGENLHAIENDKKIPEKVSGTNKKDRIEEKEVVGKVSKTEEKDNNATTASGENLEKSTMEDDTKIPKKAADKAKTDPIGKTEVIDKPSKTEEKDNIALAASDEKLEKTTIKDDKKITEKVSGKTKEDAIEKTKVIRKRSKTEEKDNIPTTESGEKLDKITVEDDKKITEKMSGKTKKDSIEKTEVVEKPSEVEEKDNLTASGEKLEKVTVEDDKKITEKVSGKTKEDAIEKTKVIRKRSKTEEKDNIPTTESGEKLDKITVEDDKEITEKMSGKTKKDSVEKTEVVEKPSKVEEKVKLTASGEKLEKVTIEDDKKITEKISGKTEKDATEKTEVVDEPRKAEEKENIVTKAISKKSGEKLEKNNIEDVKISEEVSSKNKKDDIDEKRIVEKVSKTAEQDTTVTVAVTKESGEELLEQSTVDNATKITKRGSSKSKKDARKKSEDFVRPIISKDEENKLAITKDFELGSEKPTITDTKKVTENVSSKSEKDTTRITETLEKNKSQKKKSIKSSKQVGQVESSDSSDKSELSESTKKLGSTEKLQAIGVIEKTKCKEKDTSLLGKSIKKEASSIKDDLTSDSIVKEETKKEHFPDLDMQYKSEGTLLKSVESTRTYDSSRREDELKKKLYIDESTTSDYSSESISDSLKAKKSYSYDPRKGTDDSKSISDLTDNVLTSVRYAEEKYKVKSVTSYDESKIQHKQTEVKPQFCGRLVDRTAGLGTKVKVTCSLIGTPEPTVKWYKDGQPLSSDDLRVRPKLSGGLASLEISEASLQDSGRYTCVARNAHGETSTTATVKIFSYAESAPEAPKFTQQIRDHYKSTSDELVVECRVRGYPQPTVTWLKDGQQLPSRSRYQHSVLRDGTCRLTVHGPEPNDSGLYKCEAVNSVWTEQTSSFVMFEGREKYLADIRSHTESRLPRFTNIVTDHVVREGGTLALQVAVKGSPRADITWYRGSEPLPKKSSRFRYMEDAGVYSLIVSEAARSEAGLYTCRASNVHGYRDTSVKVEVVGQAARGKPAMFVSRPDTNLSLAVGEDITLSFRVSGDPKPKVTWMKGMKDITNNIRTLKETVNDYVRLTLKHATVVDAGTYFIMAKNVYGTDHAFVTVKLKQRARSLTPTGIRSLRSSADILRDVHESARALVKDVPGPITGEATVSDSGKNWVSLTWGKPEYRGAAPVLAYRVEAWLMGTEGGAQWVELGVTPINSFDAFFLKPGAEYKFRITARNRYGWGEPVTTAETITIGSGSGINFPPEILRDLPGPMKALEGDSITLECEVTGDPAPDIQWLRDGHDISKIAALQDRVTISDSQLTHRLILKGLTDEDSGRYVCEAANKAGRASTYARLLVVSDPRLLQADRKLKEGAGEDQESAPQFTMRLRDRRVQATYPVRLSCQAVGNPAPSISWTFNGTSVTNDDRHQLVSEADHFFTLEISRTQLDDGGLYTVTAQNCLGAVSCHCQLTVDKGIRAYIAPDFTSELSPTVTIKHGAELRLFAQVEAYPTVGIAWQRDGVRLRPSRRLVMNVDPEGRVELALASVTVKDAGLYTCTATNAVGRAETTSQVSVTGTPFQSARVPTVSSSSVPYTKEPRFVTKPRSSEAVEGDTVVIDCEVVGDPKPEVMWLRDWLKPEYYRDAPQFRQLVGGSQSQYSLEIPQVKLDFTGTYCVIARNPHGEAKAIISLQIYAKGQGKESSMVSGQVKHGKVETLPEIKRDLKDLRCCDGDSATLECQVLATPPPSVRWEKDGKILPLGQDIEAEVEREIARLTIKKVYPEDEGTYSCVAYNQLGRAVTSACLVVDVPEEKETLLSQQLIRPPGLLSSRSTPRSTPRNTPSPARSISPISSRYREFSSPSFSRPKRIKMSSPKFYTVPHNRIAEEGETVRFQCAVAGHPTPWASWDKDGHIVTPSSRLSVKERDDMRTLELQEVTVEDAGLYRVTLENEMGSVEATARLDVIGRQGSRTRSVRAWSAMRASPTFGRRLVGSAARVGGTFTLSCDVNASPAPVTSWYRNGEMLVMTEHVVPSWDGQVARLELRGLREEDAGVYTCVAENYVGTTQCGAELRVIAHGDPSNADLHPPVFLEGLPPELKTEEGQPLELQTRIQGSGPLEVVWVKDGVEIPDCADFHYVDYGDGRFGLRIADLFVADSGIYNCEAFNDHGDAITSGHLIVSEVGGGQSSMVEEPEICFTKTPSPVLASLRGRASFCARLQSRPLSHTAFTWTVAGRSVSSADDRFTVTTEGDCTELHIAEVRTFDVGPVTVTARVCSPGVPPTTVSCGTHLELDGLSGCPAQLLRGPSDTTVMRGDRVLLKAIYRGSPEPSVRWLKAGRELQTEGRVQIASRDGVSCLTISAITADDSGKYVISVENSHGADCHFASVAVEGPPEPLAARPSVSGGEGCAMVTWSSPAYDGGCVLTGYRVEMRTADSADWSVVADRCHSLSHVVRGLEPGQRYVFRVRAENIHGVSESSAESFPFTLQSPEAKEEEQESCDVDTRQVSLEPGDQFMQRYSVHEELGKGRYGVVHKVTDLQSGNTMAAKFVRCIKKQDREKVQEEIDIMNCLRHPKLLQLSAAFENTKDIVMVMEYISGGELFERVVADDFTLTERDCILFLRQICEGVSYMHKNHVVHLDLKPENIMCHTRTSHRIKIIDFGLAQKLESNAPVRVMFGTPEFIPPEILNYEPIGTESDMWSVGVICYVLLSGLSPFMGDVDAETYANITRADYDFDDEAFDAISQDAKDFISSLLVKRQEKRLSADECLRHKWMTQCDMSMSCVKLCTDKLKKFIIRRKWQKTGNAIRALGRMVTLSANSRRNSSTSSSSPSPRPSLATSRMSSLGEEPDTDANKTNRSRVCSERSDSGISDCSSITTNRPLMGKKYSICEEPECDPSSFNKYSKPGVKTNSLCDNGNAKVISDVSVTAKKHTTNSLRPFSESPVKAPSPTLQKDAKLFSKSENFQKAFAFWKQ